METSPFDVRLETMVNEGKQNDKADTDTRSSADCSWVSYLCERVVEAAHAGDQSAWARAYGILRATIIGGDREGADKGKAAPAKRSNRGCY